MADRLITMPRSTVNHTKAGRDVKARPCEFTGDQYLDTTAAGALQLNR
jgi:hypothetical protein